jgi:iron complex outermembrane receptor protein
MLLRPPAAALVACLALASSPLLALDGQLLLPTGAPAAGFSVTVVGRPGAATTDAEGNFRLLPDPAPPFVLLATDGAGKLWSPVAIADLTSGEALVVNLAPTYQEELTVGVGLAPSLDTTVAAAAVVLSREDLEQRRPQHLYDALAGVAGASQGGEGADSVVALRGLPKGRTLLLVDGARVTAERRAGASAGFLDPFSLAAVEIARGPGGVAYGSDAFGGVVDARTADPDPGRFALRYDVAKDLGAGDLASAGVQVSAAVGPGSLLAVAFGRESDGYEGGDGEEIANSSWRDHGGGVRWAGGAGQTQLRFALDLARVRDLGKAATDSNVNRSIYPQEDSDRFTAHVWRALGGHWESLEAGAFLGSYRLILDRERQPNPTTTRRLDQSDVDANDASLRVVAARGVGGAGTFGRLRFGGEVVRRFGLEAVATRTAYNAADAVTSVTRLASIEDGSRTDSGAFVTYEQPLGARLSLAAGLRADVVESRNRGGYYGDRSERDSDWSGQVGITAQPWSSWSVTAQVARGFRSPTLSDRYFRGPSGRGFVTGNPDLAPETSRQLDLAVRWARGGAAVALYGYSYRIDDLIERYGVGDNFFFRNRDAADIRGVELEGRLPLAAGLALELALASARGEAVDGNTALDDIAAPGGWLTVRWAGSQAGAYLRAAMFGRDDEPGPSEAVRPGYLTLDLGGSWALSPAIELRASLRNATDRRFTAAADEVATLAPGRTVSLALAGHV